VVVDEARRIIFMMENVTDEEMPPKSIWHSPKKCVQWVKDRRDDRTSKKDGSGGFLEFKETEVEKRS
jgi:hypothetical protein